MLNCLFLISGVSHHVMRCLIWIGIPYPLDDNDDVELCVHTADFVIVTETGCDSSVRKEIIKYALDKISEKESAKKKGNDSSSSGIDSGDENSLKKSKH